MPLLVQLDAAGQHSLSDVHGVPGKQPPPSQAAPPHGRWQLFSPQGSPTQLWRFTTQHCWAVGSQTPLGQVPGHGVLAPQELVTVVLHAPLQDGDGHEHSLPEPHTSPEIGQVGLQATFDPQPFGALLQ